MATPNAVVAKLHNQASYEEGEADEALEPGQGCVLYEDADGNKHVRAAAADEQTTRVVREPRNPPRGQGVEGESPLAQGYDAGETVETIGFNDHDQARCRVTLEDDGSGGTVAIEDAEMGWDANGTLSTAATDPVARGRVDLSDEFTDFDMAVVEFL